MTQLIKKLRMSKSQKEMDSITLTDSDLQTERYKQTHRYTQTDSGTRRHRNNRGVYSKR